MRFAGPALRHRAHGDLDAARICAAPDCNADIRGFEMVGKRRHRKYEADHIIPIGREGCTQYIWNIQLLCKSCNCSKNDRAMEEWLSTRRFTSRHLSDLLATRRAEDQACCKGRGPDEHNGKPTQLELF
jgi:hypothetical protein